MLVVRSIFSTVHDSVLTSNVCHIANNTLFFSRLYESYILFLATFSSVFSSFFGCNFIVNSSIFYEGVHSSIVAGVRLETLITYR